MRHDAGMLRSYLGGRAVDLAGTVMASTNPARLDDVVAQVTLADAQTLVEAARSASRAQRAWADVPAPVRGQVIANIGALVEANAEALAQLVTREVGKPIAESRGEVQEIVDTCRFFLGEGRRLYGQTVPSEMPDKQLFTFREPVGVATIITAGNFPVAVPSWYLVPALLCGNTVVWKPGALLGRVRGRHVPALRPGRPARRRAQPRARRRRGHLRRAEPGPGGGPGAQGRVHRLDRGRPGHRRAVRQAPAEPVPGAGRQEPDGGHRVRRPRPGRRGCPVRRLRHGRAALHLARHGDRPRVRARRVPAPVPRRGRRCRGRRPDPRRALRASARREVRVVVREGARLDRRHPPRRGPPRPDHRSQPPQRFRRRPRLRPVLPPGHRRRCRPRR